MQARTRTRSRVQTVSSYSKGISRDTGAVIWDQKSSTSRTDLISTISDVVSNRAGFNPVTHDKCAINTCSLTFPAANHRDGVARCVGAGSTDIYFGGVLPPVDINYESALKELISDATGVMPLQMSLLVTLAELTSLRGLMPSLLNRFERVRGAPGLNEPWKDLANKRLAEQFGLKPLVKDFRRFLGTRRSIQKRIAELEARNGRTVRITKRVPQQQQSIVTSTVYFPTSLNTPLKVETTWDCMTSGALSASVSSFFVNDKEAQARMWASALGLSSPLSNVWELIPFSFVVDWFIPIGKAFSEVEQSLGTNETVKSHSISHLYSSLKVTAHAKSTVEILPSYNYPSWSGLKQDGSSAVLSRYYRAAGVPAVGLISAPSGWNISRTANALSLIFQMIKR